MPLDCTPLRNTLQRLDEGLARHFSAPADAQLHDGLIQRFEFTYELSHRTLRRYLIDSSASPQEVARMSFADLIRAGNAAGLLREEWVAWRRFRDMPGRTSHTDGEETAADVVAAIPDFLAEEHYLCTQLERRLS